jgi:flagellar biosynthesis protein FliQ
VSKPRPDLKRWLMRGLAALLVGSILMLIAILVGTVIAILQALS